MDTDQFKVDRSAFSVISLDEQDEDEKRYWQSKTPLERLEAVEIMRQVVNGYDPATTRLQRVLEIATQDDPASARYLIPPPENQNAHE